MNQSKQDSLRRMLAPQSVAVVGASNSPAKVGFTILQNLVRSGFPGHLFPVNNNQPMVQGRPAYPNIADLPLAPDLVIVCTPARTVPQIIEDCGIKGVAGVLVLTAGFRETGAVGAELEQQLAIQQQRFPAMRIIGPNCLGAICPWERLNASFANGMADRGSVAFLSQSGALCTAVLDWAVSNQIGFSHFISLGNQLDVGFADLLEILADDPRTSAAILYIESIADAQHFLQAAQYFSKHKPIVAAKSGRFTASAKAAASHTGAMAGSDAVYEAAFRRAGIVRVSDMKSMFECVELLTQHPQPVGPRIAIVTNAGGPGVMATDALIASRSQLCDLQPATMDALNALLPPAWSHANPVDVLGDADARRFVQAVEILLRDEQVDTVLCILTPQAMTEPTVTAKMLGSLICPTGKTLLASWMGGEQMREGRHFLRAARIPEFETPEQAIEGLMHLNAYSHARSMMPLLVDPTPPPLPRGLDWLDQLDTGNSPTLTQLDSKRVLTDCDIPVTPIMLCPSPQAAVTAAETLGYPVVAKIHSPQITHKTDVQGVALNLQNADEVRLAAQQLTDNARCLRPDATIEGVTIEPMVSLVNSVELIIGAKKDAIFGPVIMVGFGGIAAELYNDRILELAPVSHALSLRMLQSLRCWPLLNGYRGRPAANIDQLGMIIQRLSTLVTEHPRIEEVDINPLLVSAQTIIALDARIVLSKASPGA